MELKNRVIVITGASSGIGKELAFQFAAKGARVVLAARNAAALSAHVKAIEGAGGTALAVPTDVTQRFQVERLAQTAFNTYGRLDIFINNAGISSAQGPVMDNQEVDIRATMETNFFSNIYGIWAAVPLMEKTGGGQLVFVTSVLGKRGVALNAVYSASKFAVHGLTEGLRLELQGKNIRVMTVCPPGVDTPFYENNKKGMKRTFRVHPVDKICALIVRAVEKEKREVLLTSDAKILYWGNVFLPDVIDWAVAKNKGLPW